MDTFIQLTLNGLTLGSVYALIALGYSLVYGILKLLNFAHGDVFMVGSFIGFGMLQLLGGSTDPVVPIWLLLVADHARRDGGLRRARRRDRAVRLPAAARRAADRAADQRARRLVLPRVLDAAAVRRGSSARLRRVLAHGGALFLKGFDIGNVRVPLLRIIIIVAAFVLMALLWVLVTRTRTGKAMQATSYDREAAAMMGIDIDRVIVFAFVLGSALAGAAGVLFALRVPTYASIGFLVGLKGFTAAVIGGIGSIPGAMAGGLILGFAEAYTQGYISTRWSDLLVFVILILFMLFRPQGLLGKADIRKV